MLKIPNFKKILLIIACSFIPITTPFAEAGHVDVDALFKQLDLMTLVGTSDVLNVMAQMKHATDEGTNQVSDFDDFIALSTVNNQTVITEFDANQTILNTMTKSSPWIGVARFEPNELDGLISLQEGLQNLQTCMDSNVNKIANLVIYKSLRFNQIIYNYRFVDPRLDPGTCQEWLYIPTTNRCEKGYVVSCQLTVQENKNINEI